MSKYLEQLYKLKDKTVLITGSSGQLGSALCKAYLNLGANVIGIDITEKQKKIDKVLYFNSDIKDQSSVNDLFNNIMKKYKSIDILINNAGVSIFSPFEKRTSKELDSVIDTNLKGTFYLIQAFIKNINSKIGNANIVNIGSMYGVISPDFRIYSQGDRKNSEIYGATKAGIIQLTKYFAVHLADKKIRVNSISPGGIYNPKNPQSKEFIKKYSFRCPMKRMAEIDEIVGGVIFFSSNASSYITGQNLVIDGGMSCW